ncbi:MAG: hypothetical protein JNM41_08670 [Flavipsychrobacter sp.]|nr:hypothetical protein [Flavipsychrobacter sp.]
MKIPTAIIISVITFSSAIAQKQPKVYFGAFGQVNGAGAPKAFTSTQAALLENTRLKYSEGCSLMGYTVSVLPKGGGLKGPMAACTPSFPERVKSRIVELGTDAIVYVENLRLLCNDMPVEVPPFTIKYEQ